ncbi:MAG: phage tail sheath C-terminal domain-containing protein [Pseudomonadota bacterium]
MSFLHGVEVVEIDGGPRPISTVASSVIGLVGTAKKGPVNQPVLITGSRKQAIDAFGLPDGSSTIPDALNAIFDQGGAMVVVINVQAKQSIAATDYSLVDGAVELKHSYVSELFVTGQSEAGETLTYQQGRDFTIASQAGVNGKDELRLTLTSGIDPTATLSVAYSVASDTPATKAQLVSSKNPDGGIPGLLGAESKVKVTPRMLIAPGFSDDVDVVNAMITVADRLRAIVIADGPDTTDTASIDFRQNFDSARLYIVDPQVLVFDSVSNSDVLQPASSRVAGIIAKSDNERGFWWSPSNRTMLGINGTSRAIDFTLGDKLARANLLNDNEVATIIHQNGYRLWGNRSCASDPKFAFISVRRTADLINDSLLRAHLWAVDRNITKTYIDDVTEGVNDYLRHLKTVGAIIDGKCWADPELNTPAQIAQGKVFFDFDFTPPYPAEHITFRSRLTNDYLEEMFA